MEIVFIDEQKNGDREMEKQVTVFSTGRLFIAANKGAFVVTEKMTKGFEKRFIKKLKRGRFIPDAISLQIDFVRKGFSDER